MKVIDIQNGIYDILSDMGTYIIPSEDDFDLTEYMVDSLHFISFILQLEDKFHFHYPDALLYENCLSSFANFSVLLLDVINKQHKQIEQKNKHLKSNAEGK